MQTFLMRKQLLGWLAWQAGASAAITYAVAAQWGLRVLVVPCTNCDSFVRRNCCQCICCSSALVVVVSPSIRVMGLQAICAHAFLSAGQTDWTAKQMDEQVAQPRTHLARLRAPHCALAQRTQWRRVTKALTRICCVAVLACVGAEDPAG